jgi:hypothetical protein
MTYLEKLKKAKEDQIAKQQQPIVNKASQKLLQNLKDPNFFVNKTKRQVEDQLKIRKD